VLVSGGDISTLNPLIMMTLQVLPTVGKGPNTTALQEMAVVSYFNFPVAMALHLYIM
jgi:hypothetical protein